MRYLPSDNLAYPVLIEVGKIGSGSGFYFRTEEKLFLVTARHVLFDTENKDLPLRENNIKLISYSKDLTILTAQELMVNLSQTNVRKDDIKDIALVELGVIDKKNSTILFNKAVASISGVGDIVVVPSTSLKKFNDVLVSNEVFILGYPISLGMPNQSQIELKRPLLRKGIVAGLNLSNETIILDCPVYFGNSGGMAIEVDESGLEKHFKVIGVVSQFIPFVEFLTSNQMGYANTNIENSGYSVVVPIDSIFDLTTEKPIISGVQN